MNNSNRAVEIGLLSGKNMELLKIQKNYQKKNSLRKKLPLFRFLL